MIPLVEVSWSYSVLCTCQLHTGNFHCPSAFCWCCTTTLTCCFSTLPSFRVMLYRYLPLCILHLCDTYCYQVHGTAFKYAYFQSSLLIWQMRKIPVIDGVNVKHDNVLQLCGTILVQVYSKVLATTLFFFSFYLFIFLKPGLIC